MVAAARTPVAFTRIYTRAQFDKEVKAVRSALLHYATRRVGPNEAEDVVQQTLLFAYRVRERFDSLDGEQAFAIWLMRICAYKCREHCRRAAQRGEVLVPIETAAALYEQMNLQDLGHEVAQVLKEELYRILRDAPLTGLQEYCLRLWLDGHSQSAIAEHLMVSQPTVCEHIRAATRRLCKYVEGSQANMVYWCGWLVPWWFRLVCEMNGADAEEPRLIIGDEENRPE